MVIFWLQCCTTARVHCQRMAAVTQEGVRFNGRTVSGSEMRCDLRAAGVIVIHRIQYDIGPWRIASVISPR